MVVDEDTAGVKNPTVEGSASNLFSSSWYDGRVEGAYAVGSWRKILDGTDSLKRGTRVFFCPESRWKDSWYFGLGTREGSDFLWRLMLVDAALATRRVPVAVVWEEVGLAIHMLLLDDGVRSSCTRIEVEKRPLLLTRMKGSQKMRG